MKDWAFRAFESRAHRRERAKLDAEIAAEKKIDALPPPEKSIRELLPILAQLDFPETLYSITGQAAANGRAIERGWGPWSRGEVVWTISGTGCWFSSSGGAVYRTNRYKAGGGSNTNPEEYWREWTEKVSRDHYQYAEVAANLHDIVAWARLQR